VVSSGTAPPPSADIGKASYIRRISDRATFLSSRCPHPTGDYYAVSASPDRPPQGSGSLHRQLPRPCRRGSSPVGHRRERTSVFRPTEIHSGPSNVWSSLTAETGRICSVYDRLWNAGYGPNSVDRLLRGRRRLERTWLASMPRPGPAPVRWSARAEFPHERWPPARPLAQLHDGRLVGQGPGAAGTARAGCSDPRDRLDLVLATAAASGNSTGARPERRCTRPRPSSRPPQQRRPAPLPGRQMCVRVRMHPGALLSGLV